MNELKAAVASQKAKYGISTKDIADALGMSPGNVNKIIREGTISYAVLRQLSNYLHFSEEQKKDILT